MRDSNCEVMSVKEKLPAASFLANATNASEWGFAKQNGIPLLQNYLFCSNEICLRQVKCSFGT